MRSFFIPLLFLSIFFVAFSTQVNPSDYTKILDFAKGAANQKVQGRYRFKKCDFMDKSVAENGNQYYLAMTYVDRVGVQKIFQVTVYENPVWDSLQIYNLDEH